MKRTIDGRGNRVTLHDLAPDDVPGPATPEAHALVARGRAISADADDPDSPLHDAAVAEAAAIREAGWGRALESLGLRWGREEWT